MPTTGWETAWVTIGFLGQGLFTARFLVQWLASERKREAVVPVAFWWLSLAGGLTLLTYAIHRADPVIIVGQATGVFIYIRNLMIIGQGKPKDEAGVEVKASAPARPHVADRAASSTRQAA